MKVLVCGAGVVTVELLKRLGDSWRVTLIEKDSSKINNCLMAFSNIIKTFQDDASSPVVLDKAGIEEHDYVLALSNSDEVNKAVVEFAQKAGVDYILALAHDIATTEELEKKGIRVVMPGRLESRSIYQYLQDPRIAVTSLSQGKGEVIELDSSHYFRMIGKRAWNVKGDGWRLAAIFRKGELLIPDRSTIVEGGDKLVIIGKLDSFQPVCTLLECEQPHFPLAYGQRVVVAMLPSAKDQAALLDEAKFVAHNTMVTHLDVLCSEDKCGVDSHLKEWNHTFEMNLDFDDGSLLDRVLELKEERSFGCIVLPPFESNFFMKLKRPPLVDFAHKVNCPVLIARGNTPHKRILVPFNRSPRADLALEVAVDFAKQVGAEIDAIMVEEEDFIHGEDWTDSADTLFERVRELAHIHKIKVGEVRKQGNPVKEIVEASGDYDLMVIGSSTSEKGLFFPHVGELLAERAPCSVLIVTS